MALIQLDAKAKRTIDLIACTHSISQSKDQQQKNRHETS